MSVSRDLPPFQMQKTVPKVINRDSGDFIPKFSGSLGIFVIQGEISDSLEANG